jgi:NAD(P)-dependent dehydrogenase (short-subunit alcohol dehydrogenase family)
LGRYTVSKLAKAGTQVVVPYRDEDEKRHLKVMGDLGQVVPLVSGVSRSLVVHVESGTGEGSGLLLLTALLYPALS